jgi:hypothetical protein
MRPDGGTLQKHCTSTRKGITLIGSYEKWDNSGINRDFTTYILVGMIDTTLIGMAASQESGRTKSASKGEMDGPKDTRDNRSSRLHACISAQRDLANASAIENLVSQHGRA